MIRQQCIENILNTSQKAEASPAVPYLSPSPESNPATSSTSAVNANVNLTNVRLEEPTAAPYNSYQPQAGPLRTSSTEGAHVVLRDQEPSSLPPHIDPAKVPVLHCCADFLLYIKLAHDYIFILPLFGEFFCFFPLQEIMQVTKHSASKLLSII